jgi:hypothetical protein
LPIVVVLLQLCVEGIECDYNLLPKQAKNEWGNFLQKQEE